MSVAGDIADAVVTAVKGLGLLDRTADPPRLVEVVRRKLPSLPPGKDPPQVVVSVGEEGDTQYLDFEGSVIVRYPVAVTIVTAGGRAVLDDDEFRDERDRIKKAVDDPDLYADVDEFHRVESSGKAPFDTAALTKDLNFAVIVFTVQAVETRTGS